MREIQHQIDASDKSLGRLASEIAVLLRGKTHPTFQPNQLPTDKVVVTHVRQLKFTGNKMEQKKYYRYSGFPGGLHAQTLEELFAKNPGRVLWLAVYRMLARNRMRDKIIKHLVIK